MDPFMRDSDAFSWRMEDDPVLRSTVVAVALVNGRPDWPLLRARLDRNSRLIPMLRQRVVEFPGRWTVPRWTFDPDFDLDWHLRRIDAPEPRDLGTVVEFARREAMTAFDRSRPLWVFTLIGNLRGGGSALVMKIHHALTDGIGGIQLALTLFDRRPKRGPDAAVPPAPAGEHLGQAELLRQSMVHRYRQLSGLPASVVPLGLGAARRPLSSIGEALETTRSVGRTVAPVARTLSPLMGRRGLGRHLDLIEVGLGDLKRSAAAAGGTLNDGFMAGVIGGLRLYHQNRGIPVERLRVTLPISIRRPEDPVGGNRITLMRLVVPASDSDPAARVLAIHELCRSARDERSLPLTNLIAAGLNLLPRGVVGAMFKHVDFLASDVPGFDFPVFLAGSRVKRYFAFGPTIGASLNTTLLSYEGNCAIGVNIDTAAVPDPGVLIDCLRDGLEEILALGDRHGDVELPLHLASVAV